MNNSFLIEINKNDNYIKDPIHKEINFKNNEWAVELITTKEFKRLKEIKQLGVAYKVFPSATHSRYSHSIGTYQVALKFVNALSTKISNLEKKIFLCSALLHDIGHGPFSHVFEKISNIKHEEITKKIILDTNSEINKILLKNKINPKVIIDVINGSSKYQWINKLVSSNIDVDRIDYLLRDSYFIGTNYSTIDVDFLIERTHLINNNIYFSNSSLNVIESFLLGRYYMHEDIYNNKHSYIFEWALISIFDRLKEIKNIFIKNADRIFEYDLYSWLILDNSKKNIDLNKFCEFNDVNFISFIVSLKKLKDKVINSFIDGFVFEKGIIAVDFSKKNFVLNEMQKIKNISKIENKYIYCEVNKRFKKIYFEDENLGINIINTQTNTFWEFNSSKLIAFKNTDFDSVNKIILVNQNLLV